MIMEKLVCSSAFLLHFEHRKEVEILLAFQYCTNFPNFFLHRDFDTENLSLDRECSRVLSPSREMRKIVAFCYKTNS